MAFLHPITQKEKTQSPKKENHKENNSGEVNRSHLINRTVSPQSFAAILKFIKLVLKAPLVVFRAALSSQGKALLRAARFSQFLCSQLDDSALASG